MSATSAPRDEPRLNRFAAVLALVVLVGGLAVTLVGQRLVGEEVTPARTVSAGRYWIVDPLACVGLGAETPAACAALNSRREAELDREHQNRVTVRNLGVVLVVAGTGLLVGTFVTSRRAAERLLR